MSNKCRLISSLIGGGMSNKCEFPKCPTRMTFCTNRNASVLSAPYVNLMTPTDSPERVSLYRLRDESLFWVGLLTYYSNQNVKFKLNSLQLLELEKLDFEIQYNLENTGKYDCKLLMKKFLLLESYNIPDIGNVYEDETISKNFPMDLLRMILLAKGRNTDNLSKTQMINELSSYDRTVLAFTMVPSVVWGPEVWEPEL